MTNSNLTRSLSDQADRALEGQDEDIPMEVLPNGDVRPAQPAQYAGEKKVILRDPKQEYGK